MTTADILRGVTYFSDLPQELLDEVCAKSEQLVLAPGTVIIEEGSSSEDMYVLVDGELIVTKLQEGKDVELARTAPGEVVGELALIDKAPRTATVKAAMESTVVRVPAEAFDLLLDDPGVARKMIHTITTRLRNTESTLRHEERMAALGRMAAQLMHELNNPAAAVGRSSQELDRVYQELGDEISALGLALGEGVEFDRPTPGESLSALERADREEAIAIRLTGLGVEDAWNLAEGMVSAGWTPSDLDSLVVGQDADLAGHLARFAGLRAMAGALIGEVAIGARRISELVRIVKEYSYLDQAPVQEIVVTKGIEDTLVLLKHKTRDHHVVTEFDPDLRPVEAPGRDLNQIWTNLIDNACDAMAPGGTLTVSARNEGENVVVRVSDTGTGIPDDVAAKIFDPFFTTKEPGKGTGLGLHTVHTILARVGASIEVESSPEGTTFTVTIPAVAGT